MGAAVTQAGRGGYGDEEHAASDSGTLPLPTTRTSFYG